MATREIEPARNTIRKRFAGSVLPTLLVVGGLGSIVSLAADAITYDSKLHAIEREVQQQIPGFSSEEFDRLQRTVADFKKVIQTQTAEQIPSGYIKINEQVPQDVVQASNTLESKGDIYIKGHELVIRREKYLAFWPAMKFLGGVIVIAMGALLIARNSLEREIDKSRKPATSP